jgi:hypothetical protein
MLDLLNQYLETVDSSLQTALFHKDSAGQFENIKITKTENATLVNEGFIKRREYFVKGNNSVDLFTKLNLDLFNSDRYLINNVTIRLRLIQNKPQFCLLQANDKQFAIKINKAQLFVRKVKISPSVIVAHNLALEKTTAKYPIKRVTVSSLQIQSGIKETIISNFCLGPLPNRVVFGLVESEAQAGHNEKNPFNFQHFNLSKLSLTLESTEIPYGQPLEFNFENNNYVRGYYSLFEGIDKPCSSSSAINREEYLCSGSHLNLAKTGELSIKLTFGTNTDKVLSLIILKEFDNLVECS